MERSIEEEIELEKKLAAYDGPDKIISSIDLRDKILAQLKEKKKVSMKSNIPALDRYIQDFTGGELSVLSGSTGMGKTLFAQSLTQEFFNQGKFCLWFTYEVPPAQFLEQFIEPLPIFMLPEELIGTSLEWIRQRVWEAKLKYGLDAVFIDHLHFLIDMKSRNNISLEIGFVMRELKRMAIKFNVAIFLLAHTQKFKLEIEPDLDAIRDSGLVACEADNVFFIWRLTNTDRGAIVKIGKNRRYGVMGKKIRLEKTGKYLREVADDLSGDGR